MGNYVQVVQHSLYLNCCILHVSCICSYLPKLMISP